MQVDPAGLLSSRCDPVCLLCAPRAPESVSRAQGGEAETRGRRAKLVDTAQLPASRHQ